MILTGAGKIFDEFAPVAPVELRTAFAGGADEGDGEALVVHHGDKRGFAIARQALDPHLTGIHFLDGLEEIQCAARAPGPRAQGSPVLGFAGLAFVAQTDDAFGESGAIVSLNTGGNQDSVAPAPGENLLLPGRRNWIVGLLDKWIGGSAGNLLLVGLQEGPPLVQRRGRRAGGICSGAGGVGESAPESSAEI